MVTYFRHSLRLVIFLISTLYFIVNVNVALAQYTPPDEITLTMYRLVQGNGSPIFPLTLCKKGDQIYGCTADTDNPDRSYPFGTAVITIGIEGHSHNGIQQGYLHNVVPSETNPQSHYELAVQAQSVAALTFAYFEMAFPTCSDGAEAINNSTEDQVYIPFMYESQPGAVYKSVIDQAVANRYYMSYAQPISACGTTIATDYPIFSEFSADAYLATIDHPEQGKYPYMQGVPDPISSHPEVPDIVAITNSHQRGLSQNGASRWANGNLTSNPAGDKGAWSVRWENALQILTHYYTGIHIRDANDSNRIVTPAKRWVPLKMTWPTADGMVPERVCSGSTHTLNVVVQNTGTETWLANGAYYFWFHSPQGVQAAQPEQPSAGDGLPRPIMPIEPGQTYTATIPYTVPQIGQEQAYDAYFEMVYRPTIAAQPVGFSQLEADHPWPAYRIPLMITPCSPRAYLPFVQGGEFMVTSQ